jgi:predicted metal-binding protein
MKTVAGLMASVIAYVELVTSVTAWLSCGYCSGRVFSTEGSSLAGY